MGRYHHRAIERKWQNRWRAKRVHEPNLKKARRPFYNLMMFPYPSAEGLHVGNMYAFVGSDVYGRMKRMQGYDLFEPMGLDGFGIHSENYAIKVGAHPAKLAKKTERNFYRQLQMIGNGFAWSEQLETWKPEYYRWTQWIFAELFKRGLAYRKKAAVNWCTSCLTVLADEQVAGNECERCGNPVIKKELEQWFFKITQYAERLLQNLDRLDWSERVKTAQRRWIGKSEGVLIPFTVQGGGAVYDFEVFSTRPDTLFGVTYLVLAPEHPLIARAKAGIENFRDVQEYLERAKAKKEEERTEADREKTGIPLRGLTAVHPGTNAGLPIWVSDYVLGSVGTGAVMAVPGHDERDFSFAKKFGLPIVNVIQSVRPKDCLLIHDVSGTGNEHWFPWLKAELEKQGWKVAAPDFPQADHPDPEAWAAALAPYRDSLNEQSVVIGHGLGAHVALRFLEDAGKRIAKLILVAPISPAFDWRKRRGQGSEIDWETVHAFQKATPVSWEAVKRLAGRVLVYYSDNDHVIPGESIAYYRAHVGEQACRLIHGRFHFDEYHGITDFPELLTEFESVYTGEGILFNSGEFDGMSSSEARDALTEFVRGKKHVQYRIRDWLISRQRYWGPPIPLIFCDECAERVRRAEAGGDVSRYSPGELLNPGWLPVPEKDLPVRLPFVKEFRPTGTGVSPLASAPRFLRVRCPRCKAWARRETDVSDTFLDSAWYFFRYLDSKNRQKIFDRRIAKKWLPVNMYIGGAEHSVLHLLYTRFITMVLRELGLIDFEEPFLRFRAHGLLVREGAKMSKSKGNVINPDTYIQSFGADALRMYLMFLAPFEEGGDFQDRGIVGIERFLGRVYAFFAERRLAAKRPRTDRAKGKEERDPVLERMLHQTIRKITEDIEALRLNTAVSALMVLLRGYEERGGAVTDRQEEIFLKLIAPFAPHLAQELWARTGHATFLERERWPEWDERFAEDAEIPLIIQVNGKFRDTVMAPRGMTEKAAKELALGREKVRQALGKSSVGKVVFVPDRLINLCTTTSP